MTLTLPFPTSATVTTKIAPEVHIAANVDQFFSGPNKMDITNFAQQMVMMAPENGLVADNLKAGMFEVEHVHNDPK